ncbi:hypothetical protein BGZ80_007089 [Entomortierella chlamydospora]|uniref:Uncharacterized protein n=1 Tax=Entomortierella chlamydospora TaxID=101097 RepID=A0A9P6MZI7_9FUNG|nr:hypothetical protein BGZ80_007089 [Entomortierella chlamydospora]
MVSTPSEKSHHLDEEYDIEIPAGVAPDAYYDTQLSPLRASLRRFLLPYIRSETPILHAMQLKVRTPILDAYFTMTAFSGNHTFFMVALPILFWFGYSEIARGFTFIAAMGVYWAGFYKVNITAPKEQRSKQKYMSKDTRLSEANRNASN